MIIGNALLPAEALPLHQTSAPVRLCLLASHLVTGFLTRQPSRYSAALPAERLSSARSFLCYTRCPTEELGPGHAPRVLSRPHSQPSSHGSPPIRTRRSSQTQFPASGIAVISFQFQICLFHYLISCPNDLLCSGEDGTVAFLFGQADLVFTTCRRAVLTEPEFCPSLARLHVRIEIFTRLSRWMDACCSLGAS